MPCRLHLIGRAILYGMNTSCIHIASVYGGGLSQFGVFAACVIIALVSHLADSFTEKSLRFEKTAVKLLLKYVKLLNGT